MTKSFARLDAFARGQVIALHGVGLKPKQIRKTIRKKDASRPTPRAIRDCIKKFAENPEWRGENKAGPGRHRIINDKLQGQMKRLVFKERGSVLVTIKYLQKKIPKLRKVKRWAIAASLQRVGLQWLRRREKRWLSQGHREGRIDYANWVKRCTEIFLKLFVYIDGTTFYLARGAAEAGDLGRKALGSYVWRMATNADGLFRDTVGPSLYAAKQGKPVKVWGFLSNGFLCLHVLPLDEDGKTTHMNGVSFRKMMFDHAPQWKKRCWGNRAPAVLHLVQDHERCLWQEESLKCLASLGMPALSRFPVNSPDLNAIEEVWSLLRRYLEERAPIALESRESFIARLRGAVNHFNASKHDVLLRMCRDQKDRAKQVLDLEGSRINR